MAGDGPDDWSLIRKRLEAAARSFDAYVEGECARLLADREGAGWRAVNALGRGDELRKRLDESRALMLKYIDASREQLREDPTSSTGIGVARNLMRRVAAQVAARLGDLGLGGAARIVRHVKDMDARVVAPRALVAEIKRLGRRDEDE